MKKSINKKIKITIACLGVILIILLLIIVILNYANNNKKRTSEYVRPEVIQPMFSEKFFNQYNGDVAQNEILETLSKFVYYIVDNKAKINNLDETTMNIEYSENEEFYKNIGIQSEEAFTNIMSIVKNIDQDKLEVSYTSFEINSLTEQNGIYKVLFAIKFSNVDEITLNLNIESSLDKSYIISIER